MSKKRLIIVILCIAFIGFLLRLIDYDHAPPFGETKDEFMYPFAGISLLQTGMPTSWSPFAGYTNNYQLDLWGEQFRMVTPWLDKPPLYPLLVGVVSLLAGENEFQEVRMSTFRLIPVTLSFFTIFLTGLVASVYLNKKISILAAILYAVTPTIVLGNRMGLTENLLVPLSLLGLWLFHHLQQAKSKDFLYPVLVGLVSGLVVATKQIGAALPLSIVVILILKKEWKKAFIVGIVTTPFLLINPLMGFFYDWRMYQLVMSEFSEAHALGLPETIATLFRIPGIGHKESIFLDGAMLSGFILFFASPFGMLHQHKEKIFGLLLFPFIYVVSLTLLEGGTTWYGWHLFPLYPFLVIVLAYALYQLWHEQNLLQFLFFFMILGASSMRFLMVIHPSLLASWQTPLGFFLGISMIFWFFQKGKLRKEFLLVCGILFVVINIYTVIDLSKIYPSKAQPLTLIQYAP